MDDTSKYLDNVMSDKVLSDKPYYENNLMDSESSEDSQSTTSYDTESDDNESDDNSSEDSNLSIDDYEDTSNTVAYNYTEESNINNNKLLTIHQEENYNKNRNLYFTKDIEKHSILIDTKNLEYNIDTKNYEYVVDFQNDTLAGMDFYKNVIGFKLIKANIKNIPNIINDMNNILCINEGGTLDSNNNIQGGTNYKIEFNKRDFDDELTIAGFIQETLHSIYGLTKFSIDYDNNITSTSVDKGTHRYSFTNSTSSFILDFEESHRLGSSIHRLLGFKKSKYFSNATVPLVSEIISDFSFHYVDIVCPQIPYIACKKNLSRKHIIERININVPNGAMIDYHNYLGHDQTMENYFFPITLNRLEIQLYSDSTDIYYQTENSDNNFEFQITILKNLNILK